MQGVEVVSRREWGARPPKAPYTKLADSEGIVVHHEGDGVSRDPATTDYAAYMRATQRYHMDTKGWNDIAYGWAVGGGKIYEGRNFGWIDGADTGVGRLMHSVVWLGDSYVNAPTLEDLIAFNAVIAEHAARYPHAALNVKGHRDINATGCPGEYLADWLKAGRPAPKPNLPTTTPELSKEQYMARHAIFQTRKPGTIGENNLMAEVGIGAYGITMIRTQTQPNSNFTPWISLSSQDDEQPFVAQEVTAGTNADGRQEIVIYGAGEKCARKVRNTDGSWRDWATE